MAQKTEVVCMSLTNSNLKKAVQSHTMSKRYINTMLRAAVINILYHRLNIKENEFINKKFNNVVFKSFRSKSKDPFIRQYHSYMNACKEAIEKNYLKDMYLYFINSSNNDIIENYKFAFQYSDEVENGTPTKTGETLIETTTELLQTLEDLGKHEKVQEKIDVKVEFTYFDDTPKDYQPQGFQDIKEERSYLKLLPKQDNSILLGTLYTGFHLMKCRARGNLFNFNTSMTTTEMEADMDLDMVDLVAIENDANLDNNNKALPEENINANLLTDDMSKADNAEATYRKKKMPKNTIVLDKTYSFEDANYSFDEVIDCSCNLGSTKINFHNIDVDNCVLCNKKCHLPCSGIMDKKLMSGPFYCLFCTNEGKTKSVATLKFTSKMRLVGAYVVKNKKLPTDVENEIGDVVTYLENGKYFTLDSKNVFQFNESLIKNLFRRELIM